MKPILYVEGVNKIFGSHKEEALKLSKKGVSKNEILEKTGATCALLDVNLDVFPGETFVIIGLSGSGKSTLVRMFNRLNDPTHGKIFFKNQDLAQLNKEQLRNFRREKIAMVFQHFGLMSHRTVLKNVEYGLESVVGFTLNTLPFLPLSLPAITITVSPFLIYIYYTS